jgi:hypothetical protein
MRWGVAALLVAALLVSALAGCVEPPTVSVVGSALAATSGTIRPGPCGAPACTESESEPKRDPSPAWGQACPGSE